MAHNRILILDGDPAFLDSLKETLRGAGFDVESHVDPHSAEASLHDEAIGVILLGSLLKGGVTGIDFLADIRQAHPALPVLFMVESPELSDLIRISNLGISGLVDRPIDMQVLDGILPRFVTPKASHTRSPFNTRSNMPQQGPKEEWAPFEVEYPNPIALPAACRSSRWFQQKLWANMSERRHCFVIAPNGCELELVQREVSIWRGRGGKRLHQLSAVQLRGAEELLNSVASDPESSPVILVHEIGTASANIQDFIPEFVRELELGLHKNLTFIFHLEPSDQLKPDSPMEASSALWRAASSALWRAASSHCAQLRPLSKRLPDLAAYVKRYLEPIAMAEGRSGKLEIDPSAMAVLLCHKWPGEFEELVGVLRRAVHIGAPDCLDAECLLAVLHRVHGSPVALPQKPDLKGVLHAFQSEILTDLMSSMGNNLRFTLSAVGSDPAMAEGVSKVDELPLLVGDLV